ncbi:MAG: hypothetical protein SFU53_14195 [Terrimicrobiaceae bacterium]|nr:hypothetical protein [Terrimicrobiaceae bacterium]
MKAPALPLLIALWIFVLSPAAGATLAFENFAFPSGDLPMGVPPESGDGIVGQGPNGNTRESAAPTNGALGFATGYVRADGNGIPQVGSNTLGFPGVDSGGDQLEMPPDVRCGRYFDTSPDGPFAGFLNREGRIGADGRTLWMAFLFQAHDTSGTQGVALFQQYIRGDGAPIPVVNIGIGDGKFAWRRAADGSGTEWQPLLRTAADPGVRLFVLKFEFAAEQDTLRIFVDPDPSRPPADATANGVVTAPDLSFEALGFSTFGDPYSVSNIRIADDYAGALQTAPPAP